MKWTFLPVPHLCSTLHSPSTSHGTHSFPGNQFLPLYGSIPNNIIHILEYVSLSPISTDPTQPPLTPGSTSSFQSTFHLLFMAKILEWLIYSPSLYFLPGHLSVSCFFPQLFLSNFGHHHQSPPYFPIYLAFIFLHLTQIHWQD